MITAIIIIMETLEFEQHDKHNSLYFIVYKDEDEVSGGSGNGEVSLNLQHLFCGDPSIN